MTEQMVCRNTQDAMALLKLELERHLRTISCPVHDELPDRVTVTGKSVYDMHFQVEGCCDILADTMLDSIGLPKQTA